MVFYSIQNENQFLIVSKRFDDHSNLLSFTHIIF